MNFSISVPELCLIRFCVRDQTGLLSSEFVGQYTLPFNSLKKGEPAGAERVTRGGARGLGAKLHKVTLCDLCCILHHLQCQPSALCSSFMEMMECICIYFHTHLPCTPPGYRWVPLLSRDGCSLDPASLFVFVWYS